MAADFKSLSEMQLTSCEEFADRRLFGVKKGGEYQWMTYGEFGEQVDQCRGGLAELGIERGDRVACIADNRVEWAVGAYACYGLGAIWVPMYQKQLASEWKYIIGNCGAKAVIVANDEIYGDVKGFPDQLDDLEHIINLQGSGEGSWKKLLETGADHPVEPVETSGEDVCGFIYTSGTTGNPKGVVLSHENLGSNVKALQALAPVTSEDVSLSFLPWAHSFGQTCELHSMMSMGASLGLAESIATLMDNFGEVRPTLLFSVPRIFNKLYDRVNKMVQASGLKRYMFNAGRRAAAKKREVKEAGGTPGFFLNLRHKIFDKLVFSKIRDRLGGRLKYAFSGGAALSPAVAQFIDDMKITVYEGYGLTETSPVVTANSPKGRRIGSVGRAIPGCEVVIDGADGKPNVEGEVLVSGPNVMQEYHNLPEQTAEVIFERDGKRFFRTGDLGKIDEDGFLFITGRVKELYKLENGKYVSPAPLEEQIQLSGYILQAYLDGANKPFNVALIVPDKEALTGWAAEQGIEKDYEALCQDERAVTLIEAEIAEFTKGFKRYEIPKVIGLVADEFTTENGLLTPSLKIKRRKVVDMYADLLDKLHSTKPKSGPAKAKKTEAAEAAEEAKELEPREQEADAKAEGSDGEKKKKKSDAKSKPSKGGEATPPAA